MEEDGSYAVVRNAGQSVHLSRAASEQALRAARENISFVVSVDDVDSVWDAVKASAPPVELKAPESMAWGCREFHMFDLDGCLLRFRSRGAGSQVRP